MAKYEVSKLNYTGNPDFGSTRTINDTESKMFIQLAKEIHKGARGFYIYQSANRSGLKVRFLVKNPNGKGFAVLNKDMKIIMTFTVNSPEIREPSPAPKKATAAPKKPSVPAAVSVKPKPYWFIIEQDYKRSKQSGRFATIKEVYIAAYKVVKANRNTTCVLMKGPYMDGDFLTPSRNISYSPWYDCPIVSVYGKHMQDYRLYADGKLKKLTRADIKRDF